MQFHQNCDRSCLNPYMSSFPFISESKRVKLTMQTQLPFDKDKDFQQSNFFLQILIVSIVCTAGCKVRYLISVFQSNKRSITPITSKQEKKFPSIQRCPSMFFSAFHTNVSCNHSVKTMYYIIPSKLQKRTDQHANKS